MTPEMAESMGIDPAVAKQMGFNQAKREGVPKHLMPSKDAEAAGTRKLLEPTAEDAVYAESIADSASVADVGALDIADDEFERQSLASIAETAASTASRVASIAGHEVPTMAILDPPKPKLGRPDLDVIWAERMGGTHGRKELLRALERDGVCIFKPTSVSMTITLFMHNVEACRRFFSAPETKKNFAASGKFPESKNGHGYTNHLYDSLGWEMFDHQVCTRAEASNPP